MKIRILGTYIKTRVDPLNVRLCSVILFKENVNSYQQGIVQHITLKGVGVVSCDFKGVKFVKWCNVEKIIK
jgi:hypothetical protein